MRNFFYTFISLIFIQGCGYEKTANVSTHDEKEQGNPPSNIEGYSISANTLLSKKNIARDYKDKFTLDDIKMHFNRNTRSFTVVNNSPRYLYQPTIQINTEFYHLLAEIGPFEQHQFSLELDGDINAIEFVEQQPFFKTSMKQYSTKQDDKNTYSLPTEEQAYSYEQEMRGYKNALNDYEFNVRFAQYINHYGTNRAVRSYSSHDLECPHDDHNLRTGADTSTPNHKILSMLTYSPNSSHRILNRSWNGVATIGQGWLAVRDFRLYSIGQQYPKSTYLHEKMHNHGFNHSGGMNTDLPSELIAYTKTGQLENYYQAEDLAKSIPTTVTQLAVKSVNETYLDVYIQFLVPDAKNVSADDHIQRFMLVIPDGGEISLTEVKHNNVVKSLNADTTYANGKVLIFDTDIQVNIHSFSEQSSSNNDYIKFRVKRPAENQTFAFLASGKHASWSRQANHQIQLDVANGFTTEDGQLVFLDYSKQYNSEGILEKNTVFYTPEEAMQFCTEKGFSLGFLKPFKSQEQMDFQMKYLPYNSQVGIDPDTLQPVAVSVASSYRPDAVTYAEKGELIVCAVN